MTHYDLSVTWMNILRGRMNDRIIGERGLFTGFGEAEAQGIVAGPGSGYSAEYAVHLSPGNDPHIVVCISFQFRTPETLEGCSCGGRLLSR